MTELDTKAIFKGFTRDLEDSLRASYFTDALNMSLRYDGNRAWGDQELHLSDTKYTIAGEVKPWEAACPHQLILRLKGALKNQEKDTLGRRRMFEQGYVCEDIWLERSRAGMELRGWEAFGRHDKREIPEGVSGFTGTPDWVFTRGDIKVVIDAKTRRADWYKYQGPAFPKGTDGFITSWPAKPVEELQVQGYLLQEDGTVGGVFAGDRGGSNRWVISLVERDDERVIRALEGVKVMQQAGEAPKIKCYGKVAGKLPWQCDYCDFYGSACGGAE